MVPIVADIGGPVRESQPVGRPRHERVDVPAVAGIGASVPDTRLRERPADDSEGLNRLCHQAWS